MENRRPPFWILPNLLSLDAPLVAVAWVWMLARALRVEYIPTAAWWVLAAAIWCVYVLDRVLDVWMHPELREHSPRHWFHWRWRWGLIVLVLLVGGVSLYQAFYVLSRSLLTAGIVAGVLCVCYFLLSYFRSTEVPYVKNFFAGMIFAMGVGIPVNASGASLLVTDLNDVVYAFHHTGLLDAVWNVGKMMISTLFVVFFQCREIWVFGLLCIMNITAIDLWERAAAEEDEEKAYSHEASLTLGLVVLAGGALLFAALYADEFSKPFFYAIMIGAAALQVINHYRSRFSMNALRVMADLALLIPLPLFWVLAPV